MKRYFQKMRMPVTSDSELNNFVEYTRLFVWERAIINFRETQQRVLLAPDTNDIHVETICHAAE